jgi:hypothetical protein
MDVSQVMDTDSHHASFLSQCPHQSAEVIFLEWFASCRHEDPFTNANFTET